MERIAVPGAPRSTEEAPVLENPASPSVSVVAATQIRFGASTLQGVWGSASLLLASLPAATTYSVPGCDAIACATAGSTPEPLVDTLATCAPMSPA